MQPGSVFRWDNFPLPKDNGKEKARWFVHLGCTGIYVCPAVIYLVTSTTQIQHYVPGGSRARNLAIRVDPAPATPFDSECVIDLDSGFYNVDPATIAGFGTSIEIKGVLSKLHMQQLWQLIDASTKIPKIVKRDIKRCFEDSGVFR